MNMTPGFFAKAVVSLILNALGIYYLASGKKNQDVQKMLTGAVLIVAGMLFF